jgi:hypothetical protein
MTSQRSFKHTVRARMARTGESYTTARRHLLPRPGAAPDRAADASQYAPAPAPPADAGVSPLRRPEARVVERTGRPTQEWYALLDGWQATHRGHTEIARWLVEEHGVPGWWAQSLTVGYEQARGLRAPGQHRDGTFRVTVTRTVAVPAERARAAFADEAVRDRWLPPGTLRTRPTSAARAYRADVADGSRLAAGFDPVVPDRARVSVSLERLPDAAAAAAAKVAWRERLDALVALLSG